MEGSILKVGAADVNQLMRGSDELFKAIGQFLALGIKVSIGDLEITGDEDGTALKAEKKEIAKALVGKDRNKIALILNALNKALKNTESKYNLAAVKKYLASKGIDINGLLLPTISGKDDELIASILSMTVDSKQFEAATAAALTALSTLINPGEIAVNAAYITFTADDYAGILTLENQAIIEAAQAKIASATEARFKAFLDALNKDNVPLPVLIKLAKGEAVTINGVSYEAKEIIEYIKKQNVKRQISRLALDLIKGNAEVGSQQDLKALTQFLKEAELAPNQRVITWQDGGKSYAAVVKQNDGYSETNFGKFSFVYAGPNNLDQKYYIKTENGQMAVYDRKTNRPLGEVTLIADGRMARVLSMIVRTGVNSDAAYGTYQRIFEDGAITKGEYLDKANGVGGTEAGYHGFSTAGNLALSADGEVTGLDVDAFFRKQIEYIIAGMTDEAQQQFMVRQFVDADYFVSVKKNQADKFGDRFAGKTADGFKSEVAVHPDNQAAFDFAIKTATNGDPAKNLTKEEWVRVYLLLISIAQFPPAVLGTGGAFAGLTVKTDNLKGAEKDKFKLLKDADKFLAWLRGEGGAGGGAAGGEGTVSTSQYQKADEERIKVKGDLARMEKWWTGLSAGLKTNTQFQAEMVRAYTEEAKNKKDESYLAKAAAIAHKMSAGKDEMLSEIARAYLVALDDYNGAANIIELITDIDRELQAKIEEKLRILEAAISNSDIELADETLRGITVIIGKSKKLEALFQNNLNALRYQLAEAYAVKGERGKAYDTIDSIPEGTEVSLRDREHPDPMSKLEAKLRIALKSGDINKMKEIADSSASTTFDKALAYEMMAMLQIEQRTAKTKKDKINNYNEAFRNFKRAVVYADAALADSVGGSKAGEIKRRINESMIRTNSTLSQMSNEWKNLIPKLEAVFYKFEFKIPQKTSVPGGAPAAAAAPKASPPAAPSPAPSPAAGGTPKPKPGIIQSLIAEAQKEGANINQIMKQIEAKLQQIYNAGGKNPAKANFRNARNLVHNASAGGNKKFIVPAIINNVVKVEIK